MSGGIKSDTNTAAEAANMVTKNLGRYCIFSLDSINAAAPVPGSAQHDELDASLKSALTAWFSLLTSDASAIKSTGATFEGLDSDLARNLLGLGGDNSAPFK